MSSDPDLAAVTREEVREVYWRVAALSRVVFTANPDFMVSSHHARQKCGNLWADYSGMHAIVW